MGITDNGGADQHKNACPNDRAYSKAGQIPSRESFFQPVGGMVGVGQDLFNRLRSKQIGDHQGSLGGRWRHRGRPEDIFIVHVLSSIAGRFETLVTVIESARPASRGFKEGLEQPAMTVVTVEQKFGVPLNAQQEPLRG
jgi:hypothetical protein